MDEWRSEGMNERTNERTKKTKEWRNDRTNKWINGGKNMQTNERTNERTEWMNERTNKQVNEWKNQRTANGKRTHAHMNRRKKERQNERTDELMITERTSERTNERTNEALLLSQWLYVSITADSYFRLKWRKVELGLREGLLNNVVERHVKKFLLLYGLVTI